MKWEGHKNKAEVWLCGDQAELRFSLVQAQPCLRGATTLRLMEANKNFDTP
jgi:hypothetical protein